MVSKTGPGAKSDSPLVPDLTRYLTGFDQLLGFLTGFDQVGEVYEFTYLGPSVGVAVWPYQWRG